MEKGSAKQNHQGQQEERIDLIDDDCNKDFNEIKKRAKVIKKSTLSSSLLRNVKVNYLSRSTAVRTFPGARIDTIKDTDLLNSLFLSILTSHKKYVHNKC